MSTILFLLNTSFLLGLLGLSLHRTHLMSILICIEGMMLVIYLMMAILSSSTSTPTMAILPILLLAMSACEASSGLALLVATSRTHGTDHMKTLNLLKC
uniref:NADH-ubiquinone oxidoreductase chain 4L n=2 Tax=Darevskia TaxID=122330 RepID=A0A6B7FBZ2_9SAUR|nr:NADH dehydrogenase subunit 4L [Darevskia valentini]YP_009730933.1 NADH dehydrogenase subunit 4L [Darevskia portschinskii]YP_009730946.1 NADH dehydrogenase subunit 4L [Darevskia rudis]QAY81117.1 NADH dehydrogenase subunit 4L [Darevskia valentini]QBA55830.1 NADH dehydrogenase subunit 4L [Darevskia portschinskii]QBA55843.1 NADH dehydrogenase subunit 4L [Darevskia rudis]